LWVYDKPRKNLTGSPRGSAMALTLSCNHHNPIFVLISLELLHLCMCFSKEDNIMHTNKREDSSARLRLYFSCDYYSFTVCYRDCTWMGIMQCAYILSDSLIHLVILCCFLAVPEKHQVVPATCNLSIYLCVADEWTILQRHVWLSLFDKPHNRGTLALEICLICGTWFEHYILWQGWQFIWLCILYNNKFCAVFFSSFLGRLTVDTLMKL
jgi:hypothetical protein